MDREQLLQALRASEARKSAILDAAFDSVITIDADGMVVEVNPATERMFGYSADEMIGRELAELIVPAAQREAHRAGVARYAATGRSSMHGHPFDLPAMRADGTEFPVEIAITCPEVDGPLQFTGFLRDVTDRKRDEAALRSLAEEQAALRRVATAVAAETPQERLFAVVAEEVGRLLGAHAASLLRYDDGGSGVVVGTWGAASAREFRSVVQAPISLAGRPWGAVVISRDEAFPEDAARRVADFAELVALALANAEARAELAASRARIVEAGDAERRRIERNLHDGAQQRLVGLSLILRLADRKLSDEGGAEARELLARANAELDDGLQELRELARGIHPAVLTDRGLEPALEMLAGRASLPVELCTELDSRLPRTVEAAAYYVVAEALTNAVKYACASRVTVTVAREDGTAMVDVADDGQGGADPPRGSGLRGLADRIEALGGTLEVVSPPGEGTTLRARMPC